MPPLRHVISCMLLFGSLTTLAIPAHAQGTGVDFLQLAFDTKANITNRLAECGTERFSPLDRRLPPPRITANEAYANLSQQWLAGYFDRLPAFGGQSFVYKRPDGGYVAWMDVAFDSELAFSTSTAGQQARMVKYFTPAGEQFYFLCQSQYVDESRFRACVEALFVQPLLRAFCR